MVSKFHFSMLILWQKAWPTIFEIPWPNWYCVYTLATKQWGQNLYEVGFHFPEIIFVIFRFLQHKKFRNCLVKMTRIHDSNRTSNKAYFGHIVPIPILDTIQVFVCELGMKPRIIFSLYHVIVRPTKIIKDLCKVST